MKIFFTFVILLGFTFSECNAQTFTLTSSTLHKGDSLVTRRIEYSYNKIQILTDSQLFLDSLAVLFLKHDSVSIKIESHTDQRGNNTYNEKLSSRRAQSLADYLFSKGVAKDRIVAIGCGENKPLVNENEISKMESQEEQEEAYSLNRRTVFIITSVKYKK